MADEIVINDIAETNSEDESLVLKFTKPYIFEGESYRELDMSGLENIRGRDIIDACRKFSRGGDVSVAPQLEIPFTIDIAVRATGLPKEFFDEMPPAKLFRVHSMVLRFFNSEG